MKQINTTRAEAIEIINVALSVGPDCFKCFRDGGNIHIVATESGRLGNFEYIEGSSWVVTIALFSEICEELLNEGESDAEY